ncbi:MAG: PstS family phosphate ABC transporter substrate-binding protein [Phycisphaerae bacterium]
MPKLRRTAALMALAALWLLVPAPGQATVLKVGGTGAALGTMRLLCNAFSRLHPDVTVEIPNSLGSGGGIQAVLHGAVDIALSARPLKERERAAGARELPYARTPFILYTSRRHPEITLTRAEVVEIFTGHGPTWPDGTPIRVILRPEKDSDTDMLTANFPGMDGALKIARISRGAPTAYSDQDAMDLAERAPGSVSTGTLTAVIAEKRPLKGIPIDGVAPSVANLENGSYTLAKTLSFVTGPEPSEMVNDFIRFVNSAEGAAVLRGTGNLPLPSDRQK